MRFLVLALIAVCVPLAYARTKPPTTVTQQSSSYVVYMPNRYMRGKSFPIYIIIYGVYSPVRVSIYINHKLAYQNVVRPAVVRSDLLQMVGISNLHTMNGQSLIAIIKPRYMRGRYSQIVRVTAVINKRILFQHSKYIYRNHYTLPTKKSAILVQKDKPFYKPNDLVRFRCFGLKNYLDVMRDPFDIEISDPLHNVLAIWHNQTSRTGVISKEFKLSDQPNLGTWRIMMKQKLRTKYETFTVGRYVLPPIKVTLGGDKYICHLGLPAFYLAKRYINIIVKGRYSFGGPVKGRVILLISINGRQKISIERSFKFYGYLKYRFYLREFFEKQCESIIYRYAGMPSYITLTITARVIEEETDLDIMSAPMLVSLVKAPIRIDAPYSISMKPGLCNEITIYIRRIDGKPLTWDDVSHKLNVTFITNKEVYSQLHCIPLDGVVTINLPRHYYSRLTIYYYGHYQDCHYTLVRDIFISRFQPVSHYYVRAKLKKTICYAGDDIRILIESTALLIKVYYVIIKDDNFIDSGCVFVYGYFLNLNLKTSKAWLPGIKILFTCITNDNYVLVDVLPIKLTVDFKYQVTGLYTPHQNRAGRRTNLNMASAGGSTLFIVAVDERLEFLKKPKYISKDMITNRFMYHHRFTIPSYINNIPSLLRWCQLNWMSNKIPTYGYIRHHVPIAQRQNNGTSDKSSMDVMFTTGPRRQLPLRPRPRPRPKPSVAPESTVKVRDRFEEVWIWLEKYVGRSGHVTIPRITPDSITTWKTNAFAVHPTQGISVLETPLEFLSFQEMFLILNLPYCIIRTERLVISVIVFNYLPSNQLISVNLKNSALLYKDTTPKKIKIGPKSYKAVRFSIRPKTIGNIPIELELYRRIRGRFIIVDRLKKYLKVKPDGHTFYINKEFVLDMQKRNPFRITIPFRIPSYAIKGSERIEVSLTGDIMGPAIAGLGKYVRLPRGCGEQTALHFVPNIYIYFYLKSRKALDKALETKLVKFTRSGYQNQLRYQKRDGSYSAFQRDKVGSVWLTAFISKSFQLVIDSGMKVYIDKNKLRLSLLWLLRKQLFGGNFIETGRVIHKGMQGGAARGVPLTAYLVIAINSMKGLDPKRSGRAIKKAVKYLRLLNLKILDDYTLCILLCTYAKLHKHTDFNNVQNILLPRAKETKSMLYWDGKYAIEQTAYVLLAYAHKKNLSKGKKILTWLLTKRNSLGGFSNTQDTVVALEAMAKFALFLKQTSKAVVTIRGKKRFIHRFKTITKNNLYLVQQKTLPSYLRRIKVNSRGNGVVYLRVSCQYNAYLVKDDKFGLSVSVKSKLGRRLMIIICFEWILRRTPGMVVTNVRLPSGFAAFSANCHKRPCDKYKNCTRKDDCFSKMEPTNDGLNLYLDNLRYKWSFYIIIIARRIYAVDNKNTNLYITTQDYYTGKINEISYNPFTSQFPDMKPA